MSDNELYAKLGVLIAGVVAVFLVGWMLLVFVGPIFLGLALVDTIMRQAYGPKLKAVKSAGDLVEEPSVEDFDARILDGNVAVGWVVNLPGDAHMDIYRLEGSPAGHLDEIETRGICVHSTKTEITGSREALFIDYDAPDGVLFYAPILRGMRVEKVPLDYSFFDFAREVQYRTKRKRVEMRGQPSRVVYQRNPEPVALPDERDEAEKMAEEIVSSLVARKTFDSQLDAAITRINANSELTEQEKLEAIELLETRAAAQ